MDCLAYVIDPDHVQYCVQLEEQAQIIARAVGGVGQIAITCGTPPAIWPIWVSPMQSGVAVLTGAGSDRLALADAPHPPKLPAKDPSSRHIMTRLAPSATPVFAQLIRQALLMLAVIAGVAAGAWILLPVLRGVYRQPAAERLHRLFVFLVGVVTCFTGRSGNWCNRSAGLMLSCRIAWCRGRGLSHFAGAIGRPSGAARPGCRSPTLRAALSSIQSPHIDEARDIKITCPTF